MSFFNKLRDGASKAADKAKDSVEIAKLHTQISGKRKDIEKVYLYMGQSIYSAYKEGRLDDAGNLVHEQCEKIQSYEQDIKQLEQKIKIIKNEKDCSCGHVVPYDAKFCPSCGNKFEAEEEAELLDETIDGPTVELAKCPSCAVEVGPEDRFCESCGHTLAEDN